MTQADMSQHVPRAGALARRPRRAGLPPLVRHPLAQWSIGRAARGGRLADPGRLPRYLALAFLGIGAIWAPIAGYLGNAPETYTSQMSLILPGSGASASVNLSDIGQASSYASSPFAHNSVSPTVTYKRLLGAERIVAEAARSLDLDRRSFGDPRVELVDQTGLIKVEVVGDTPRDAQARGDALIAAFFRELDALRSDEVTVRGEGAEGAMADYKASVAETRAQIERLQRESGLISADQYAELVAETDALRRRLGDLRETLREQSEAVAALERTLAVDAHLAAATLKLHADATFNTLIADVATASAAHSDVAGRFGPNHPQRVEAQAILRAAEDSARARARLVTGLDGAALDRIDLAPIGGRAALLERLVTLDAERAGLAAEEAALAARLDRDQARVSDLLATAARLEDLQRDFSVAEAVFASAMARAETSKSDLFASYPLVQVLENPSLPSAPSSPKDTLALAAGGAATLMMLFGLLLGWLRRPLIERVLARPAAAAPEPA
jgi:uncharacterized protein involved in exopolysaccharide biosynthesis